MLALDYGTPNTLSWHGYSDGWRCRMCSGVLRDLSEAAVGRIEASLRSHYRGLRVEVCARCGWAQADADWISEDYRGKYVTPARSTGCLQQFEISDPDAPAPYLLSLIESEPTLAKCTDPRKMEEIVAYIYSQLGYRVILTQYWGDKGIDLYLEGPTGKYAVQVKRYRDSIRAERVHAFVGALVGQKEKYKGIFVTTSRYQSGAHDYVENLRDGYEVTLETTESLIRQLNREDVHERRSFRRIILPPGATNNLIDALQVRRRPTSFEVEDFDPLDLIKSLKAVGEGRWY
jgi:hypothetical protein